VAERVGAADALLCGVPLAVAEAVPEAPSTERVYTSDPDGFFQCGSARKLSACREPWGTLIMAAPLESQGLRVPKTGVWRVTVGTLPPPLHVVLSYALTEWI